VFQPLFNRSSVAPPFALSALSKKDGGIRPIAVSNTLRRMILKAACKAVTATMAFYFLPVQIGFGVPTATEAAVHAARAYAASIQSREGVLKLDFKNAFSMVKRHNMFQIVREQLPELYLFVHMCYSSASLLNFGELLLISEEGVQQHSDLCYSLKLASSMPSEFNTWYLDDGTIGGNVCSLLSDLEAVRRVGPS
jgi:Reverse transcriptase (RNA-dependent DNA polymerase)